jgi:hypothetical protein
MKILNEIKGVFKLPKKNYYVGKLFYGAPYYYPWNFNKTILTVRKNRPKFLRCNYFKLFGYEISYGWPINIGWYSLGWKDKFNSPRVEWPPAFYIFFFNWQFVIHWGSPDGNNDQYYEQILWWLKYSNKDIVKAKESWCWVDSDTKKSTWNDNYLTDESLKLIRDGKTV